MGALSSTGAMIGSIGLSLAALAPAVIADAMHLQVPNFLETVVLVAALAAIPLGYVAGGVAGFAFGYLRFLRKRPSAV